MPTGIELIAQERQEQIEKHGFTKEKDSNYKNKELRQAATYCLMVAGYKNYKGQNVFWPILWSRRFEHKILAKPVIGQLTVAGAFLMAENERRGNSLHRSEIEEIAAEIDRLRIKDKI